MARWDEPAGASRTERGTCRQLRRRSVWAMRRADRAVSRAVAHLGRDETLVASAVGYEHEGRRRQVVLLTDRRILVVDLRKRAALEAGLDATSATFDRNGGRLTLEQEGMTRTVVRDVEPEIAEQIVELLLVRRRLPDSALAPRMRHVRLRRADL